MEDWLGLLSRLALLGWNLRRAVLLPLLKLGHLAEKLLLSPEASSLLHKVIDSPTDDDIFCLLSHLTVYFEKY